MARHGENIRKRKDGRWEGRYPVYSKEKGKIVYRSVYAQTYEEARGKLAEQKFLKENNNMNTEGRTPSCSIVFSDIAGEWLDEVKEDRKLSTYIKYSMIYHNHIEPNFQTARLSDITNAFIAKAFSEHVSESVQKSIYCVLNQILKFALKKYSVEVPVLKRPVLTVRSKKVKALTQGEQKKLISMLYQEPDIFKLAVLISLLTGLRLGELCALKWSDIDFENKSLTVSRTVQRLYIEGTKTVLVETMPKSECSRREIPLSDAALKLFSGLQNDKEYVFGGSKPLEPRTLQYHFKKILKNAELPDKNFHILRHTFSTNCIEGGADIKSLSELLGHSDVQITLNRYVHPSMETKRQCMNALSGFYGQICGSATPKSLNLPNSELSIID